ncbi:MAG: carboxypeptidase-like regulatory domain-containing protein [Algoriphagus sp.]|nr:carboxypeptidase-like regulatory domain-containing protein [Algoriphagus sp.]
MRSFCLFVGLFLSIAVPGFSQKNVLKGKILDEKQLPVQGASVVLQGTVRGVQSDLKGNYELKDFPKGTYRLQISLVGFETLVQEFSIESEESKELNFTMKEQAVMLDEFRLSASRGIVGHGHLSEVDDFRINAGKKNEVIRIAELNANLAMNNSRQIFAKTPGISIWEYDG